MRQFCSFCHEKGDFVVYEWVDITEHADVTQGFGETCPICVCREAGWVLRVDWERQAILIGNYINTHDKHTFDFLPFGVIPWLWVAKEELPGFDLGINWDDYSVSAEDKLSEIKAGLS